MKPIVLLLIAIAFPAGTWAQALPENPLPAQTVEPPPLDNPATASAPNLSMWDRLEHLPRGQKIKIRIDDRHWERCEFAGATDGFLYCGPPEGNAQAWQIGRLDVTDFKFDHDVRNGRLIFTAMVVTGGLWAGIRSSQTASPQDAEAAGILGGLIGMGIGALMGSPLSCVSGHCVVLPNLNPEPPGYAFNVNVPLHGFRQRSR